MTWRHALWLTHRAQTMLERHMNWCVLLATAAAFTLRSPGPTIRTTGTARRPRLPASRSHRAPLHASSDKMLAMPPPRATRFLLGARSRAAAALTTTGAKIEWATGGTTATASAGTRPVASPDDSGWSIRTLSRCTKSRCAAAAGAAARHRCDCFCRASAVTALHQRTRERERERDEPTERARAPAPDALVRDSRSAREPPARTAPVVEAAQKVQTSRSDAIPDAHEHSRRPSPTRRHLGAAAEQTRSLCPSAAPSRSPLFLRRASVRTSTASCSRGRTRRPAGAMSSRPAIGIPKLSHHRHRYASPSPPATTRKLPARPGSTRTGAPRQRQSLQPSPAHRHRHRPARRSRTPPRGRTLTCPLPRPSRLPCHLFRLLRRPSRPRRRCGTTLRLRPSRPSLRRPRRATPRLPPSQRRQRQKRARTRLRPARRRRPPRLTPPRPRRYLHTLGPLPRWRSCVNPRHHRDVTPRRTAYRAVSRTMAPVRQTSSKPLRPRSSPRRRTCRTFRTRSACLVRRCVHVIL